MELIDTPPGMPLLLFPQASTRFKLSSVLSPTLDLLNYVQHRQEVGEVHLVFLYTTLNSILRQ